MTSGDKPIQHLIFAALTSAMLAGLPAAAAALPPVPLDWAGRATGDHSRAGILIESGIEQSSGLSGTWRRVTDLATGRTRAVSDYGVFSTTEVWDGHTYWRQDASGGVHPIDSAFMQQVHITDGWLAARGYWRRDAAGAVLEDAGVRTAGGRSFAVVRATPEGGQPLELWFDQRSHVLARTVQVMSTYVRTIRYEDYRSARGLPVAHTITAEDGISADTDVIRVSRVELAGSADADFRRPQLPDDFSIAGGKTVVPIDFDGDVVLEARLNGQGPYAFILDTGGHDILTPTVAGALGLKPVGAGASGGAGEGTLPEQYVRIERVEIGGLTLRNQSFTVIPLQFDTVERGARPALGGILGLELFERFAMRLDYANQTLAFQPLAGYQHAGAGLAVPIFFGDDQPLLIAEVDGESGEVGIDTGNSGTLVVQGIWADQHGLKPRMRSGFPALGFGTGGISPSWASRADLTLAGQSFPKIIAHYAEDKRGAFSSRTEAGNVGNEILASFVLEFDYGHGQIWFQPGARHSPEPFNRAGMTVYKERAEAFRVASVASGTPAAAAGLQVDDEIIAVDGIATRQLSGWDFRRAVRRPVGTRLTLSVLRQGQPQMIVITLRELLP